MCGSKGSLFGGDLTEKSPSTLVLQVQNGFVLCSC